MTNQVNVMNNNPNLMMKNNMGRFSNNQMQNFQNLNSFKNNSMGNNNLMGNKTSTFEKNIIKNGPESEYQMHYENYMQKIPEISNSNNLNQSRSMNNSTYKININTTSSQNE